MSLIANLGVYSQSGVQKFIYQFLDSSVPPQYHRSYSITVNSNNVQFVVDSYGEILLNETYTINQTQFNDFVKQISSCKLRIKKLKGDGDCNGGTAETFVFFFSNSNHNVDGSVYHCGGNDSGNLTGDLVTAKELFRSMVPDINTKIEGTRKE